MVAYTRTRARRSNLGVKKTIGKTRTSTRKYYKRPAYRVARYNFSRKTYGLNKAVSQAMHRMSETKLSGMKKYDELAPAAIQVGALATQINLVLGGIPSGWTGFSDLEGMGITQGVEAGQRIGDYVYMKKGHLTLEIDMKATVDTGQPPIEFRCILYKARRGVYPSGTTKNPSTTLFLDEEGNKIGSATGGINGTDLMRQPLNRRDYTVLRDHKFMLSSLYPQAGSSSRYGSMKRYMFNMPFYKKAHFANPTEPIPEDLDYHYAISIFARSLDKDTKADQWEINTRGTVSWTDN